MAGLALLRFTLGLATLLLADTALYAITTVHAQAPIQTPLTVASGAEFTGTVVLTASQAPDGTSIDALIGSTVCGTATTQSGRYDIRVRSGTGSGVDYQQGCGQNGNMVTFRSGSLTAMETGQFVGGTAQQLNLTFGQAATPTTGNGLPRTGFGRNSGHVPPLAALAFWSLAGVGSILLAAAVLSKGRRRRP